MTNESQLKNQAKCCLHLPKLSHMAQKDAEHPKKPFVLYLSWKHSESAKNQTKDRETAYLHALH